MNMLEHQHRCAVIYQLFLSGVGVVVDPERPHRRGIHAEDEGGRDRDSGSGTGAHRRHGSLLGGAAGYAEG